MKLDIFHENSREILDHHTFHGPKFSIAHPWQSPQMDQDHETNVLTSYSLDH